MQDTKRQNRECIYPKELLPEVSRSWLANCKIEKAVARKV